jgi:6-phosphofructokinase 1
LFDYEKDIIKAYKNKRLSPENQLDAKFLENGCPPDWPEIVRCEADRELNESIQSKIGAFRDPSDGIAVDTRTVYGTGYGDKPAPSPLTFPEAGPRQFHRYPLRGEVDLRVGVLVSGGIAPGINAVIDGIVKRHELYHSAAIKHELYRRIDSSDSYRKEYALTILGYRGGLQSLSNAPGRAPFPLTREVVNRQAEMGGALLSTSRWDEFVEARAMERDALLTRMVGHLENVDILYVIGGDGSMRAAHAIWKKANDLGSRRPGKKPLSVVGIPKTMDNDILWVWQSFGFLSAVEKAREAVLNLHTEAKSNPRLCILQLFGSDSGFVANHAGLASGVCDAVLIPEVDYTMEGLFDHLQERLSKRYVESPHALVVMAETAIPLDAREYIASEGNGADDRNLLVELSDDEIRQVHNFFDHGRRVRGQTPDHLRTGGLKIVSGVLQKMIKQRLEPRDYWKNFRVFTSEPRHLIRSVPPSSSDVIFAERLGTLAVDNAMAGYTDFMVSQWLTEFVLVPLELVILGRKRVPPKGIFWKSVLASTGQPEDMKTSKRKPK